jgi:hypothetical protein
MCCFLSSLGSYDRNGREVSVEIISRLRRSKEPESRSREGSGGWWGEASDKRFQVLSSKFKVSGYSGERLRYIYGIRPWKGLNLESRR